MSDGFAILKFGDTLNMVFKPNDVGPYEMQINEIEELRNGDVKCKK